VFVGEPYGFTLTYGFTLSSVFVCEPEDKGLKSLVFSLILRSFPPSFSLPPLSYVLKSGKISPSSKSPILSWA